MKVIDLTYATIKKHDLDIIFESEELLIFHTKTKPIDFFWFYPYTNTLKVKEHVDNSGKIKLPVIDGMTGIYKISSNKKFVDFFLNYFANKK
jgi:hypothetical protein